MAKEIKIHISYHGTSARESQLTSKEEGAEGRTTTKELTTIKNHGTIALIIESSNMLSSMIGLLAPSSAGVLL